MKQIILLLFITIGNLVYSQNINFSNDTTISIFTCGVGNELYSQFGHSAIRVKDNITGIDLVYNYGIFDFDDPNFYTNFAKGKLIYKIGYNSINDFYGLYQWENRTVREQILNLSPTQKKNLIAFLQNNARPENAKYQYDFLFNNCATKITDVLDENFNHKIVYNYQHINTDHTFRDLINNYVPHNSWSNVGINIALGSVIDIKATNKEHNFLPDYVFDALTNATLDNKPLVSSTKTIIKRDKNRIIKPNLFTSPLFIFSIIALLILVVTYKDYKKQKRTKIVDFIIAFITGLIGIFICLLWFATNHTATVNNLNILWALPLSLPVAFSLFKDRKWHIKYYIISLTLLVTIPLIWLIGIQKFALGITPLLTALIIRYLYLVKYLKKYKTLSSSKENYST